MNAKRILLTLLLVLISATALLAQDPPPDDGPETPIPIPKFDFIQTAENPEDVITTLEIVFLLTILTLAPSILVLMTSFTRIVIVLGFVRRALSTQEMPPTQVVVGLSLILTFMVMAPTFIQIKDDALVPYMDQEITLTTGIAEAELHIRHFMFRQTRLKDLDLFYRIYMTQSGETIPESITHADIPTTVLIPSFVISELRRAFIMGFAIFLPFLVIDLVVATTLISMGMLVLPPILISLPFKILLFILVDGWNLIVGSLALSFN
jgi:flagellar biosynthetic protein FliP